MIHPENLSKNTYYRVTLNGETLGYSPTYTGAESLQNLVYRNSQEIAKISRPIPKSEVPPEDWDLISIIEEAAKTIYRLRKYPRKPQHRPQKFCKNKKNNLHI